MVTMERLLIEDAEAALCVTGFGHVATRDVCAMACRAVCVEAAAGGLPCLGMPMHAREVDCSVASRGVVAVMALHALQFLGGWRRREGPLGVGVRPCVELPRPSSATHGVQGVDANVLDGWNACGSRICHGGNLRACGPGVSTGELVGDWMVLRVCQSVADAVGHVVLLALLRES